MDQNKTIVEWHQITIDEYMTAKQEIANRLRNISEDYVAIGFLLRQIKETEAFRQEGYQSLQEFAKSEYNLSESAVYRFIAINMKYSKDGCSKELADEYRGYGISKLSEMLNMSDEDCKLITVDTTVATIREIKKFNQEGEKLAEEQLPGQQNIEDTIEAYENGEIPTRTETVTAEVVTAQVPVTERTYTDLQQVLIEYFRDKEKLLVDIYNKTNIEDIVEQINPSGNQTYRYKIYMLFMFGYGDGVTLKKMGMANISYTWQDVIQAITEIYAHTYTDPKTVWANFYKAEEKIEEKIPEKAEDKTSEYQTPHPEGITSICYSCTEYESCNVKTGTCTKCDRYNNRAEAYKTDEQRYSEEQDRLDRETARRLKDMADEQKLDNLPSNKRHIINMGTDMFEDAISNKRSFELRPVEEEYREGDIVELVEYSAGQKTGRILVKTVTYVLDDIMGLDDDWCIIAVVPVENKPVGSSVCKKEECKYYDPVSEAAIDGCMYGASIDDDRACKKEEKDE